MASQTVRNSGIMSCLIINDLDAGCGRFRNTQMTVNNQIVMGTLMNLADHPTRASVGESWREDKTLRRVPIIITGNDLSTLYAPLLRDGRMTKFLWQPEREDLLEMMHTCVPPVMDVAACLRMLTCVRYPSCPPQAVPRRRPEPR